MKPEVFLYVGLLTICLGLGLRSLRVVLVGVALWVFTLLYNAI